MKKFLIVITTAISVALLVIPMGTVLADQSFHTVRAPLNLTVAGENAGYTLRNGIYVRTHSNGPVNYTVETTDVNGATPNTNYYVCLDFIGSGYLFLEGLFQTDNNGNGHYQVKATPEWMQGAGVKPGDTAYVKAVIVVDANPIEIVPGFWIVIDGTNVFETEVFLVTYD